MLENTPYPYLGYWKNTVDLPATRDHAGGSNNDRAAISPAEPAYLVDRCDDL